MRFSRALFTTPNASRREWTILSSSPSTKTPCWGSSLNGRFVFWGCSISIIYSHQRNLQSKWLIFILLMIPKFSNRFRNSLTLIKPFNNDIKGSLKEDEQGYTLFVQLKAAHAHNPIISWMRPNIYTINEQRVNHEYHEAYNQRCDSTLLWLFLGLHSWEQWGCLKCTSFLFLFARK